MSKELKKIVISFSRKKQIQEDSLVRLIDVLTGCNCQIFASELLEVRFPEQQRNAVTFLPVETLYEEADCAIVLGGDGSILSAAYHASGRSIPILGINFGKIGYMTELDADQIGEIPAIIRGEYSLDSRMMLDAELIRANGTIRAKRTFLNDCALSNGPVARLLNFKLYLNDKPLNSIRADGMVISTPTGSTAYSLSAGGPILDPGIDGIVLTPICPYSLSSRPIVVRDDSVIELRDITCRENQIYLTTDGKRSIQLEAGDTIRITKSVHKTTLIKITDNGFVQTLYRKLSEYAE